ncbi:MAG TPA: CDP-alcohol phosphatidyltransferase family protein [Chloroflexota bacterium]|nr:CDP-alcohol phosphatidyltransferase family protein [Chloroflexota bacterium]
MRGAAGGPEAVGTLGTRRPLRSRQTRWAAAVAGWLVRRRVRPNQISVASVVFAGLAGGCLLLGAAAEPFWRGVLLICAAGCIQLRLLCNLADGMVAIEGGFKTRSGEVYNDLPDRLADVLILVSAGYTIPWAGGGGVLGWAAGLLAVLTAYVRLLGAATGVGHDFGGPMAKQHRMALMTVACVAAALESALGWRGWVMGTALVLIIAGCAVTIARRTRRIVRALEAQ